MCEKEAVIVVRPESCSLFISIYSLSRINGENKKAQELADLASALQESRVVREEARAGPVNTSYQGEVIMRQRELADLAKSGSRLPSDGDSALKLALTQTRP